MNSGPVVKARAVPLSAASAGLRSRPGLALQRFPFSRLPRENQLALAGVAFLTLWLVFGVVVAISAGRHSAIYDEITLYESWLGRSVEWLVASEALSCPADSLGFDSMPPTHPCYMALETGPIAQIIVEISGGTVMAIQLAPRDDALLAGELIARWGKPQVTTNSRRGLLHWPALRAKAITDDAVLPVSYHAVVRRVTIFASPSVARNTGGRLSPQLVE
ncbi:MAG: hypothetical protein DIU68_000655 [Chloroflexota bacterium]|nr:MAG: hypothetical protein DIU68_08710 [Chloroflexota bacterium]